MGAWLAHAALPAREILEATCEDLAAACAAPKRAAFGPDGKTYSAWGKAGAPTAKVFYGR